MGAPRNTDEKTPKTKQLKRRIFLTGKLDFFLSPSPTSFYLQKHSNKGDGLLQLCCFSTQRATFFQRYAVYEKREGAAFSGHKFAREFEEPDPGDVPFKRERNVLGL